MDPVLAVALASTGGAMVMFGAVLMVMRYAGVSLSATLGVFMLELGKSLPFVIMLWLLKNVWPSGDWTVLTGCIALMLVFMVLRLKGMLMTQTTGA